MNISYAFALGLSAVVAGTVAIVAWQRRTAPGAPGLALSMLALTIWSLTYAVRWSVAGQAAQLFWLDATYLGVAVAPTAMLVFALQFTQRTRRLTRRNLTLLAVMPVLTLLLLWTDSLHGLFYGGMRTTGTILNGGPWFWINAIYSYGLLLVAVGLVVQAFVRAPHLYRRQAGTILLGMTLPWAGNIVSLGKLSPFPELDITPFVFILSGLVYAFGLFRYRLLDLVPIARGKLIDGMSDGVIVVDARSRIVDLNPAAQRIVGLAGSVIIGQPADVALAMWCTVGEHFRTNREAESEVHMAQEPPRDFEVRTSPLLDQRGHVTGWLMIFRDITEHKQAEQRAFELALERERIAVLSKFIQDASHEFRTPLAIMQSNVYLLERLTDPAKRQQKLAQIGEQVRGITRLVEELAEMAWLDSGVALTTRPVDLGPLVDMVAGKLHGAALARGLTLHCALAPGLPPVRADSARLGAALHELLDNALRFTPAGGSITVTGQQPSATGDPPSAIDNRQWVIVEVADTGPGMPPDVLPRIFERFYRQDVAHTTPGFGLGLPIPRAIVERHGGRLEVESETGTGSVFRIVLPV